jgi:IMP dehydrogenase/GMP reductase
MNIKEYLTFDDVLFKPQYSTVKSRSHVDLSVSIKKNNETFKFETPIIPANMKTVAGIEMCRKVYSLKGMVFLHRFMNLGEKLDTLATLKSEIGNDVFNYVGMSVGIKDDDYHEIPKFADLGVKMLCLDVAHSDNLHAIKMIKHIAKTFPEILLVAGNVATGDAAERIWAAGADVVKVGIGSSQLCSTRLVAGAGVPQLSAIDEVADARKATELRLGRGLYFISDGGCYKPADFAKALAFADFVMTGSAFAGTDSSPGEVIIAADGNSYKRYEGSSTHKSDRVEGVKGAVPYKGATEVAFKLIAEGLQSACSYVGAHNLVEFKENPEFVRLTSAGIKETSIHDLKFL